MPDEQNGDASDTEADQNKPSWIGRSVDQIKRYLQERRADQQKENPTDRAARSTARATWAIAVLTAVTIGIGVSQYVIFSRQLDEMRATGTQTDQIIENNRKLAEAAVKQAEAAQQSVEVAKSTANRQLRAYLAITDDGIMCKNCPIRNKTVYPPKDGPDAADIRFTMKIKNFGVTPAYGVRTCYGTKLTDWDFLPNDFDYACKVPCETCPPVTIGPGNDETVVQIIPAAEFVKMTLGKNPLFFYGTVSFVDTFSGKREIQFCRMMYGDGKKFFPEAFGCPEHNAAIDN